MHLNENSSFYSALTLPSRGGTPELGEEPMYPGGGEGEVEQVDFVRDRGPRRPFAVWGTCSPLTSRVSRCRRARVGQFRPRLASNAHEPQRSEFPQRPSPARPNPAPPDPTLRE